MHARFKVRFTYVEPSYARARGFEAAEYSAGVEVIATTSAEAVTLATEMFREANARSGVGWEREIRSATWVAL